MSYEFKQQNTKYTAYKKQLDEIYNELEQKYKNKTFIHNWLLKIERKLFDFILYLYRMPEP